MHTRKLKNQNSREAPYAKRIGTWLTQAAEKKRNLARGLHPVNLGRSGLIAVIRGFGATCRQPFHVWRTLRSRRIVSILDVSTATNL